jgi:hypothetical protein
MGVPSAGWPLGHTAPHVSLLRAGGCRGPACTFLPSEGLTNGLIDGIWLTLYFMDSNLNNRFG